MNKMEKDFIQFKSEEVLTPKVLDQKILSFVKKDLEASHPQVFFKIIIVQGFIGALTMIFCPQFDMSLTNNYELFHFFHRNFGHTICMLICGTIFMGSGAIFAALLFKAPERKLILASKFYYAMALSGLAVGTFYFLGANIYINALSFWLVGALSSQIILFTLGAKLKNYLLRGSF